MSQILIGFFKNEKQIGGVFTRICCAHRRLRQLSGNYYWIFSVNHQSSIHNDELRPELVRTWIIDKTGTKTWKWSGMHVLMSHESLLIFTDAYAFCTSFISSGWPLDSNINRARETQTECPKKRHFDSLNIRSSSCTAWPEETWEHKCMLPADEIHTIMSHVFFHYFRAAKTTSENKNRHKNYFIRIGSDKPAVQLFKMQRILFDCDFSDLVTTAVMCAHRTQTLHKTWCINKWEKK